jgi:hypothetical protein
VKLAFDLQPVAINFKQDAFQRSVRFGKDVGIQNVREGGGRDGDLCRGDLQDKGILVVEYRKVAFRRYQLTAQRTDVDADLIGEVIHDVPHLRIDCMRCRVKTLLSVDRRWHQNEQQQSTSAAFARKRIRDVSQSSCRTWIGAEEAGSQVNPRQFPDRQRKAKLLLIVERVSRADVTSPKRRAAA